MACTINADDGVISGSAGVKTTADTTGALNIQTNGTTAISISSAQVVSFPATTSIGTLYFGAGTVTAPSISVTGDSNTGIYFPAADTIAFTEGGVESARFDSSGNLAINGGNILTQGTAQTLAIFASASAINGTARLELYGTTTATPAQAVLRGSPIVFTDKDAIEFSRIDTSGNLLVGGATGSGAKIEAIGNSANSVQTRITNNNRTEQYLTLNTMGSTGFGVAGWNDSAVIEFVANGTATGTKALFLSSYNGPIIFATNTSRAERARIDSSGNLLVGTTTAQGKITVDGYSANKGTYTREGSAPAAWGPNIFNLYWTGNAQLWIDTTNVGNISLTSDYRIKQNVKTQTVSAIDRIAQIRPVTYEYANYKNLWKADGVHREGFIAHELAEIIPSAVDGEKDAENQVQSLKLDALCSVLVKAIQEQQAMIDELKAEIDVLKVKH